MKRFYIAILLCSFTGYAAAADDAATTNDEEGIIPGASYVVYEGDSGVPGSERIRWRRETIHAADGTILQEIEIDLGKLRRMYGRLDRNAEQPKEIIHKIKNKPVAMMGPKGVKVVPKRFVEVGDLWNRYCYSYDYEYGKTSISIVISKLKEYELNELILEGSPRLHLDFTSAQEEEDGYTSEDEQTDRNARRYCPYCPIQ